MSGTYCIGLYTPNGHRRLDVPDTGGDPWDDIIEYDRRHGTNIYDLYDTDTVEFDSGIARGLPPYDPSDEDYTLIGDVIADLVLDSMPDECWFFDDCFVTESPWAFAVYMQGEDGGIVCQAVKSEEKEADRRALDRGFAPTGGWEDGLGNTVCPSNGYQVVSATEVVHYLRRYPLNPPYKRSTNTKSKASRSRKSGTSTKRSTKTKTGGGTKKPAPKSSKNTRSKAGAKAPAKKTTRTAPRRR